MNRKLSAFYRVATALVAGSLFALTVASVDGCKPKQKKPIGVECDDGADCETNQCSDATGVCTKSCTYDKDCGADLVCRALSETANECNKADGHPVGGQCMNGGECANGICLHYVGKETQPGICSKYCQTSDDCPASYKICDKISDTGMLKVCLPGDPKAAASGSSPKFGKPQHGGGKKHGGDGTGKKKKKK
jgi:hypothetical protein